MKEDEDYLLRSEYDILCSTIVELQTKYADRVLAGRFHGLYISSNLSRRTYASCDDPWRCVEAITCAPEPRTEVPLQLKTELSVLEHPAWTRYPDREDCCTCQRIACG